MYVLVLGVIAVVSIAIVLAGRRAARRSEVGRWARATKCLNDMCPPSDESATVWCRVVGADQGAEERDVPVSDQMASLGTLAPREMPAEIPVQPIGVRQSGADAA